MASLVDEILRKLTNRGTFPNLKAIVVSGTGELKAAKPAEFKALCKRITDDYKRDMYNFENKPGYDLAVIQNRVGAFSLDGLQVANYCLFYESPISVIDREQAERRLRRQGQTRRVFQYDIVVKGSMDTKILAYHREGEELMKALLRNPGMLLKGV